MDRELPNYERTRYDARYAGNASIGFWERVNNLSGGAYREMYFLGGALQNLEGFVLKALVEAEAEPFMSTEPSTTYDDGTPGEYDCGVNPADNPVCKWTEDADGVWNGTCGIAWQCENDTPEANGMRCCPKCGRALWFTRCETYERNTRAVPPGGWSAAKKRIEDFLDDPETAPDDDWIARHAPDKVTEALRLLNLYPAFTIDYARTLAAAVRELSYACAHPYPKPHDHPRKADAMAIAVAVESMGHESREG